MNGKEPDLRKEQAKTLKTRKTTHTHTQVGESPRGVLANVLDCDVVESEIEFRCAIAYRFGLIPLENFELPLCRIFSHDKA